MKYENIIYKKEICRAEHEYMAMPPSPPPFLLSNCSLYIKSLDALSMPKFYMFGCI